MSELKIIRSIKELKELEDYLLDKTYVAYDCETDGVEKESRVIGFSVCSEMEKAFYVILRYWDINTNKLISLDTLEYAPTFLKCLINKNLLAHNGVFDCAQTVNNFGVQLIDSLHTDTMALAHLIDENRTIGLKDLGVSVFGDDAKTEQIAMKASVLKSGGQLTKENYELYKADADLIGYYGAKDALLTYKLFYHLVPQLYEQELETFFYEEETMPLLRGPTYELNTVGLRVDPTALQTLKSTLEAECLEAKAFIYQEITPLVAPEYLNTTKKNTFNIGSGQQLAWLIHFKLANDFTLLTEGGRELCHSLGIKLPYTAAARRDFIRTVEESYGRVYCEAKYKPKTKKMARPKKVKHWWAYIQCGAKTLPGRLAEKYKWVDKYLEYAKNQKLLTTYVEGIQSRMKYNIIHPSFLQCGTTSGRYSSREPNFQNLPRTEKRVKACIISRPGKVFVGADYSQLEPRVFASLSGDKRLQECFKSGEDFYSVIGMEVFDKFDCSPVKEDPDSFATKYGRARDDSKVIALSSVYGTTAPKMAPAIGKSMDECQDIIDSYFEKFPDVHRFMLDTHEEVKNNGYVKNLYGRPRRMPDALNIRARYGNTEHARLPYDARKMLNLGVNHKCQSTGASIINRAAIRFLQLVKEAGIKDCHLVLNIHDELVAECREEDSEDVSALLKYAMETTVFLPNVDLVAKPVIARNLRDLK